MNLIVDFGMGNLRSLQSKIKILGHDSIVSCDPKDVALAKRIFLPGVGHFGMAMKNLADRSLIEPLKTAITAARTPVLGICLGMQLLGKHSEEGDVEGLGILDMSFVRFNAKNFRTQHVGWNDLILKKQSLLFKNIAPSETYYFTHSYCAQTSIDEIVVAETEFTHRFPSVVEKNNVFGMQFHPEKSRKNGLNLISNFLTET